MTDKNLGGMNREILSLCINIESFDFNFSANLASGLSPFKKTVGRKYSFISLVDLLKKDENTRDVIINRIKQLSMLEVDTAYVNSYDVALATYLYALALVDPDWSKELIPIVIEVKNLFWAVRIMKAVQDGNIN